MFSVSHSNPQTGNPSTLLTSECPHILRWTLFLFLSKKSPEYASGVHNPWLKIYPPASLITSLQTALPPFTCSVSQHPDFCFPPYIPSQDISLPMNLFRILTKSGTPSLISILSSRCINSNYCFNISKCMFHEYLKQFCSNIHDLSFLQDPLLLCFLLMTLPSPPDTQPRN